MWFSDAKKSKCGNCNVDRYVHFWFLVSRKSGRGMQRLYSLGVHACFVLGAFAGLEEFMNTENVKLKVGI